MKSLFPNEMLSNAGGELNINSIANKLTYFEIQLHDLHWSTRSYAEHMALGSLYEKVFEMKDDIIEKMMGYLDTRAKIGQVTGIKDYNPSLPLAVTSQLIEFAKQLENYASVNNMPDVENLAQELSGSAAKTKYLLTLS